MGIVRHRGNLNPILQRMPDWTKRNVSMGGIEIFYETYETKELQPQGIADGSGWFQPPQAV
jgi:hypothetical protein